MSLSHLLKLTDRQTIRDVYKTGRKVHNAIMSLYFLTNQTGFVRYAIHVNRKLGIPSVRNRIKRRFREAIPHLVKEMQGVDFIVVPKAAACHVSFCQMVDQLSKVIWK